MSQLIRLAASALRPRFLSISLSSLSRSSTRLRLSSLPSSSSSLPLPLSAVLSRALSISSVHSMSELRDVVEAATASERLTVLEWKATWCGKCKTLAKELERLASAHPSVEFRYADIDEGDLKEGKREAGIEHLPVLHFIKGGELVHQIVGVRINETADTIAKYATAQSAAAATATTAATAGSAPAGS